MDAPRTWSRVATFLAALSVVSVVGGALLINFGGSNRPDLTAIRGEAETVAAVAAGVEGRIRHAFDDLAELAATITRDPDRVGALDRALEAHPEFLGLAVRDAGGQVTATAGTVLPGDLGPPGYRPIAVQSDPRRIAIALESAPREGWTVVGALDSGALLDGLHGEGDTLANVLPPDAGHVVWIVGPDGAVITGTDGSPGLVTLSTRARREAGIEGLSGHRSARLVRNGDGEEIVAQAPITSSRPIGIDLAAVTARPPVMSGTVRDGNLVAETLTYGAAAVALAAASSVIRRSEGPSAECGSDDIVADRARLDEPYAVARARSDA